ncbi:MAG: YceI family protein [Mycobacteriaceae bacterium]|nr:YceI family protein [Mycobacteriaceae bacterium]
MTANEWSLDAADGELLVKTGVTGRAAKMGHRLTIAMTEWQATVGSSGGKPVEAEVIVEVNSLQVRKGEGGVKGLSAPEKALARSNALNSLDAEHFPQIRFYADDVDKSDDGYLLTGTLEIHGESNDCAIDVNVEDLGDTWRLSGATEIVQSDFGIKPYSMLLGSMKVVDSVTVSFTATRSKER